MFSPVVRIIVQIIIFERPDKHLPAEPIMNAHQIQVTHGLAAGFAGWTPVS
jgi:hypothetical protein